MKEKEGKEKNRIKTRNELSGASVVSGEAKRIARRGVSSWKFPVMRVYVVHFRPENVRDGGGVFARTSNVIHVVVPCRTFLNRFMTAGMPVGPATAFCHAARCQGSTPASLIFLERSLRRHPI